MKEEFKKHGFEVRNEFENNGNRYYDVVKDGIKLNVEEDRFGEVYVYFKNKGVQIPKELATWENLAKGVQDDFERRMRNENSRMARALAASEKRTNAYCKVKEMFNDEKD